MGAAAEPPAAQEPACPAQPTGPEQGEAAAGEGHPPAGKAAPVVQGCDPVAAEASASSADGLGGVGRSSDPRRPQDGGKAAAKEQPSGGGSGGGPGPGSRTQTGAGISTGGLDAGAGPAGGASAGLEVAEGGVQVERRNEYNAFCRWSLTEFSKIKARALWSRYFEVGGYDCRLLVYPRGASPLELPCWSLLSSPPAQPSHLTPSSCLPARPLCCPNLVLPPP